MRAASESAERARSRLDDNVRVVTEIGELGDRTYVVEAIAEDHDTKVELLSEINAHLAEDAVLATTTSSLSVNRLAEDSGRAQKFAGLHVFNPVHRMDLVELAFPDQADDATRAASAELCEAMGKTVVEVPDVPGFVVNRLLFPFAFQAVGAGPGDGPQAGGHRLLHEAGRRSPDGPAGAAGLRGPGRVRRNRRAGRRQRSPGASTT